MIVVAGGTGLLDAPTGRAPRADAGPARAVRTGSTTFDSGIAEFVVRAVSATGAAGAAAQA